MGRHKISVCLTFTCTQCGGELSTSGAARTEDELIYITGRCLACNEDMPVPLDKILAVLYEKPFAKGSKLVN